MDEIQSGLGRSGQFIASEGIQADYYTFSKALGGNYERIAALLVDKVRYKMKFGEKYSSTFANGGMAASVAKKVLEIIVAQDVPGKAKALGDKLKARLHSLQDRYPHIIDGVGGTGLMLGLHFKNFKTDRRMVLRMLNNNDILGYLFSAFLLENHALRILPSISAPNVLRLEPSVYLTDAEIDRTIFALEDLLQKLDQEDDYGIFKFMMEGDPFDDQVEPVQAPFFTEISPAAPGSEKVVFISHFADPVQELMGTVPAFKEASATGLRILFNKLQRVMMMEPFISFSQNIQNDQVHLTNIVIPLDAAALEDFKKKGKKKEIIEKIQKAVNMANEMGAKCVGLGGYTSILTNNGLSLVEPEGTKVLTGNSMTVAGGVKRVMDAIEEDDRFRLKKNVIGIVGANGNIGSQIAEECLIFGRYFSKFVLFGSNLKRLEKQKKHLEGILGNQHEITFETSDNLLELQQCDVISVATNTNDPIVFDHHIAREKPVIISDISVPAAVAQEVRDLQNIKYLIFSSFVFLPKDPGIIVSTSIPQGSVYCCTAEAILFAKNPSQHSFRGKIQSESVRRMRELGEENRVFENLGALNKSWKAKPKA
jgi:predicted amino acid dehydrogenase